MKSETIVKLKNKIRRKNIAVWLVGLLWMLLSGVFFYLCYFEINPLGIYVILAVVAFTIHVGVGFTLKAPRLLIRNAGVYPFGIIVAQILNEISSRWIYTEESTFISFGLGTWVALFIVYSIGSILGFFLLRLVIGYETIEGNPIVSYSFYLKSAKVDVVKSLSSFIRLFENSHLSIIKEKELTWMQFKISPNRYAIAFAPRSGNATEVNLCSYQMRKDVLFGPEKLLADTTVSVINGILSTWKKQGLIDEWRMEDTPKHSEMVKDVLLRIYVNPAKIPLKIPSTQQAIGNTINWTKRNKKQIVTVTFTAIISPIIVYVITRSIFG